MTHKRIISFGFGSSQPLLDVLFSYDKQKKLKSVDVLSACGVTAEGKIFNHFERLADEIFPPQLNINVHKIHMDASPLYSELKSLFSTLPDSKKPLSEFLVLNSSLPDSKKSFSEFLLLIKAIYATKGDFFGPYVNQTDWYPKTSALDPDFAQGYLDLMNSYTYVIYIALLKIATKNKPRFGTFSLMRQTSKLLEIDWALRSLEFMIKKLRKEIKLLYLNLDEDLIEDKKQDLILTQKLNFLSQAEKNLNNFKTDLQSWHLKLKKK
jgi:hypothetical protein